MENYLDINKAAWNNRVDIHIESEFYELIRLINGELSLPSLDIKLLGDIKGKSILHLQCHFGMDTISLAKLGANVTGVDFSEKAIAKAKELSNQLQIEVSYICCDIYSLPDMINEQFDIIYTSYGVINWLPDLNRWGKVISALLKPSGRFIMVEFHPILWMFDETFQNILYSYSRKEPYITEESTYVGDAGEAVDKVVTWNYGLSEPINNLTKNGIHIEGMDEYFYSPFNLFSSMIEIEKDRFQIAGQENKIPITYSLIGKKL
ncbi:class I SAM-dependent methyltransferase [Dysgonomonas massiliensis]|uniref:class I SAM-dependent methyltransferase n=1 Tax=Dysgonomonas massiliensis TaxID=2040292 RepID=UPI000C77C8C2|nr:class I SAM-dependent methyltransferase [Dysgonomonas massiliensis]